MPLSVARFSLINREFVVLEKPEVHSLPFLCMSLEKIFHSEI